jgi:PAS domain S-box-containing protein
MAQPSPEPPLANRSVDSFRLLVEAVLDYAIFMLDPDGHVITWNVGAERINGYKTSEIVGRHFSIFYPEEDIRSGQPDRELEVAQRRGRFENEGWRIRKDGSRFWANVITYAIPADTGELAGFGKVIRDVNEERFRLLVEGVQDYAIYMMDSEGRIATWNNGAERIKGYTNTEIIGKHFSTFFTEEDVEAGKPQQILEVAAREGRSEQEGWRVRKDGSRFWVNGIVTAVHDKSGKIIGFSKITRDITERMQQQEALSAAQNALATSEASLRQLSLSLLRTQDEERRRIGREMHDSLGQYLSALKMKLGTVRLRENKLSSESSNDLRECAEVLDECLKEVRTISYLLYPPMLEEMGLKSAIGWYLDGFAQRSGISTSFDAPEHLERVQRDIELALFRVLQEALNNAHKHSGSSKVHIRISEQKRNIVLQVRDYGKGMSPSILDQASTSWHSALGVGLRGMSERMRQLGGSLSVSPEKPGVSVRATVPIRS